MQPTTDTDYKQLFSQLIKKQILILGPDITLAKVKNVPGLTVDASGQVQDIQGDPQVLLQLLINQFVELSGMIVKKTMESILTSYPGMAGLTAGGINISKPPQNNTTSANLTHTPGPALSPNPTLPNPGFSDNSQNSYASTQNHPPQITDMKLESLTPKNDSGETNEEPKKHEFSSDEMEELNRALDQLSKGASVSENKSASI